MDPWNQDEIKHLMSLLTHTEFRTCAMVNEMLPINSTRPSDTNTSVFWLTIVSDSGLSPVRLNHNTNAESLSTGPLGTNYSDNRNKHGYRYSLHKNCMSLHWRHNDQGGVSNHQPHGCLLNRLFRRRSKKTSKLRVTGHCAGNSPGPANSPHKGPVTRKMLSFDDVIM